MPDGRRGRIITVYIVCEYGHEDSGTIQAIHLVTTSREDAETAVAREPYGRYIETYEIPTYEIPGDEHSATMIVHWPTGPVACCDSHGKALLGLGYLTGAHAVATDLTEPAACENCVNGRCSLSTAGLCGECQRYLLDEPEPTE